MVAAGLLSLAFASSARALDQAAIDGPILVVDAPAPEPPAPVETPAPPVDPPAEPRAAEPPVVEAPVAEPPVVTPVTEAPVVEAPVEAPSAPTEVTAPPTVNAPSVAAPEPIAVLTIARDTIHAADTDDSVLGQVIAEQNVATPSDVYVPTLLIPGSPLQEMANPFTQALRDLPISGSPMVVPDARRTNFAVSVPAPVDASPSPAGPPSTIQVPVAFTGSFLTNDRTNEGLFASLLAQMIGLTPFAPTDGVSTVGPASDIAVLTFMALIVLLAFFVGPMLDRRRHGPAGFAGLSLRPG